MKILWAPWRVEFITEKKNTCIFCEASKEGEDFKNLVFDRRTHVFAMLNKYPYNSGHLMIAPHRHVTDIEDLKNEEWMEMLLVMKDCLKALKKAMSPDGFNIGFNIGRASGAGYEHIHLHLVPRWIGDTNFMPILSDTKVIPEHLQATYNKLINELKSLKS